MRLTALSEMVMSPLGMLVSIMFPVQIHFTGSLNPM